MSKWKNISFDLVLLNKETLEVEHEWLDVEPVDLTKGVSNMDIEDNE